MENQHSDDDRTLTHIILTEGTMVQHYRIVEKIGAGGMGEVYLAEDTKLHRKVALKFLPSHYVADADFKTRFVREAEAMAKLNHTNIITIYEVSEHHGRPFFAMELVEGQSLRDLAKSKELNIDRIIELAIQVCDGLGAAHDKKIVHRDIKPSNIVIDAYGRPKILDFGLAAIQGGEHLTKAGSTLGTVAYMSPEQAQGSKVDHRSDLFSLGIVMYELVAGRTPFKKTNDTGTMHAIINESPEPLERYKSDVPAELQRIVTKCLAKNANERYQSAADLAADLRVLERTATSGEHESSGQAAVSQPSIAVLPFANMSADPENEYFADGLTEELLNVLAKNPELKVIGRTSSFAFKGKQEDLREIGKKLGVGTILEGSVRKAGNRVRITVQLVKTSDGFHLWSESYDRVIDDIFEVQDDIAQSVAKAMNVTLLGKLATMQTNNSESYVLVLRANQSAQQSTKSAVNVAIDLYEKAIDLDPDNAQAWAGLAKAFLFKSDHGYDKPRETYPKSKKAAQQALALDDTLPEAHAVMGEVLRTYERNFDKAGIAHRKALSLAPNNSRIVNSLSVHESHLGNFEESLRLLRHSLELDPLNPGAHLNHGLVLMWSGRLDEAHDAFHRVLELKPGRIYVQFLLSEVLLLQGKLDEALSVVQKEEAPGYRNCGLAMVYHAMGKKQEAVSALADLLSCGDEFGFQIAIVYAYRGECDKAFEWLERSTALLDAGIALTKVSRFLTNLHDDPRWPELLKKIGFPE